jgi:hypothetical protein
LLASSSLWLLSDKGLLLTEEFFSEP